ncbi:hypothetical protein CJ030_MR7G011489 [Morella rubra]|uniref:Uncharacterized protein n=1 Tax=Morella rubra TaxID=262757 RepID=A0A6A1V5J8_9ROSI|nr:hypothetical protein CJ030_MR7G011489 [Morella rubra]
MPGMVEDQHLYAQDDRGQAQYNRVDLFAWNDWGQDRQAPLSVEISRNILYARDVHPSFLAQCLGIPRVFQSNSTTSLLPYPYLIMKFLSSSCITIPRNEPRLKLAQPLGPTTLNQSKSHRGPKKSFSSPSQGPMQSNISYIVKTLQLLTERSNTSSSVQSSLLATQQTLQLTLSKVLNDLATICKHLNVVGTQGASSMVGGVEDPDLSDSPLDDEDNELSASAATVHSPSDVDDSA